MTQRTFVTSDIHFFHKNIAKFCPDSRGQFRVADDADKATIAATLNQMNTNIIENFNSVVTEDDLTFILGDITFGRYDLTMNLLAEMNGTKIIVAGNHDRKFLASPEFKFGMGKAGIIEACDYKFISHKIPDSTGNRTVQVAMFHFPIEEWEAAHYGSYHLYGHQHGTGPKSSLRKMDIGVDTNNLMPYLLDDVIATLSSRPSLQYGDH